MNDFPATYMCKAPCAMQELVQLGIPTVKHPIMGARLGRGVAGEHNGMSIYENVYNCAHYPKKLAKEGPPEYCLGILFFLLFQVEKEIK